MRSVLVLLAAGAACTPSQPKPSQEAAPQEATRQEPGPVAAPGPVAGPEVVSAAPTIEPPKADAPPSEPPAVPVAAEDEPPADPRDLAARRAASPPALVEPGRFHLAAFAYDSAWIDVSLLGDAIAARAPGTLAVCERDAGGFRSEEDWSRGLDGLEWSWSPVPFHDEPTTPSPLSRGFGGRWPDDVYFATGARDSLEEHHGIYTEDPALLYRLTPEGWTQVSPSERERFDVYYTDFVTWREGQVLAAEVWHFDALGFETDNGMPRGEMDHPDEFDEPPSRRALPRPPKPPRQKLVLFGGERAPAAPKTGVARLAAGPRRTMYVLDLAGVPQRRTPGTTAWTPLPRPVAAGHPTELAVSADDTLYVSFCERTACALQRLRGETWASVALPDGASEVRGLVIDGRDDLWLAGPDALWRRRASARAPVAAGQPTDRSVDAPLEPGAVVPEVPEAWERVPLPKLRMPALALPRLVFGATPDDLTWRVRPERTDMRDRTYDIELTGLRARGDELWIAGSVDDLASVVLTTRAIAPYEFPDLDVEYPHDYDYPVEIGKDPCPALALRLDAVAPAAEDAPELLAALAEAPRERIAVIVAGEPRELVAVWTGAIELAEGMDLPFYAEPAQVEAAKAGLQALGARLTAAGLTRRAELVCWAPTVARVIALPGAAPTGAPPAATP